MARMIRRHNPFLAATLLGASLPALPARADVYQFTISPQASSLHDTVAISTPLTGSLIGSYDAAANPAGTQTRPGLFGGTGNQSIPATGSLAATDNSTTHPTGSFTLDINTQRQVASISGLSVDYLAGQHPDILLDLQFQYQTFHTVSPSAIFPGNIPLSLPLGTLAQVTAFSIAQSGMPALGRLDATGTPGQYKFTALVPVQFTLAGTVLNSPIPLTQPVTILLTFSATLSLGSGGAAASDWSADAAYQHVIPGPLYTIQGQAVDVPTVLPPGGTAHLLLNGDLGDLTIDLSASGTIHADGQRQSGPCPADFNGDGRVNVLDCIAFAAAFGAGDPGADFNHDGRLNVLDFIAFLNAFTVGC